MLRKPSLSQKKCNTGGGNPWGEMSPPAPPVHPPAGLVAGPAWDPVRSHGRGRAEGVRRDTLGATTAASGVDGPMDLAPSGLPCLVAPAPVPGGRGAGADLFGPRCARRFSARRNCHDRSQTQLQPSSSKLPAPSAATSPSTTSSACVGPGGIYLKNSDRRGREFLKST